ncbi:MAG: hypothetical protein IT174_08785 [Acidobacteria bacterium]|nr:hypothetical protein [Acidobacteriota bacterium]
MIPELVGYDGELKFNTASPEISGKLQTLADRHHFNFRRLSSRGLKFYFNGRDTGRHVLEFLGEAATIIGDADGRINAELIFAEKDDSEFEPYEIRSGKLIRVSDQKIYNVPITCRDINDREVRRYEEEIKRNS